MLALLRDDVPPIPTWKGAGEPPGLDVLQDAELLEESVLERSCLEDAPRLQKEGQDVSPPEGRVPSLPKCKTNPPGKTRSISSSFRPGHQRGRPPPVRKAWFSEVNLVHVSQDNEG